MQEVFEKIIKNMKSHKIYAGRFVKTVDAIEHNNAIDVCVKEVEKAAAEYNNGWIPCSERLPETNESVLCWAKSTARGGDVCFVGSCHNGFWFLQSSADTHSFPGQYVIVAWQTLPEPYKPRICAETKCTCNDGKDCNAAPRCTEYQPKCHNR